MRKVTIVFKLAACFLIQAFVFGNACFAFECFVEAKNNADCLSPALVLGREELSAVYFSLLLPGRIKKTQIEKQKENGHFDKLLKQLIKQTGTADELLESIKLKYKNEFGQAITALEEKENKLIDQGQGWVIEHQKEVMIMSYCMGRILGLTDHRCARLALGARFHDIGKCETNPRLINDERLFSELIFLNDEEKVRDEIAEHSARSYHILKEAGIKDEIVLSVVYYHHANADGSGYPDPAKRQAIPLEAKIARVADSFSAMLGIRPYPRPFQQSFQAAVKEIENNIYTFYGPRVVKTFQSMISDEKITNRRDELYYLPIREGGIFRRLLKEANKIEFVYPFAKVACGISHEWNEKPFSIAANSIGTHRHAEVNLALKVLDDHLREKGLRRHYMPQLRRLEFLSYTTKLDKSEEAMRIIEEIIQAAGNPFENKVIYSTLRPCAACIEFLAFLGIKQIYYASEHYDPEFVSQSNQAAASIRNKGVIIAQAHFPNEGVLKPNGLFFAFCRQPGYEKIAETINSWFAEIINHDDMHKFPIDVMRKKEKQFVEMINKLLADLNAQSDLELVNERLMHTRDLIMNRDIDTRSRYFFSNNQGLLLQAI